MMVPFTSPEQPCQLAAGTGLAWFSSGDPTEDNPWPDSWCEKCDSKRIGHGGEWNEESEAFAQIKLLCNSCYEEKKRPIESGC